MSFLGSYVDSKITEATLSRAMIINYVKTLFKRSDFPEQIFIALGDSAVVSKGDAVWMNIDCEHPYDWLPLPRLDELVLNLPSKAQFLEKVGASRMEDVSEEAEALFWDNFVFEFAESAAGVRLSWT